MKGEDLSDVRPDTVPHLAGVLCISSNEFADRSLVGPVS